MGLDREFLRYLFDRLKVDAEWCIVHTAGFDWWPSQLRQRIWIEGPIEDDVQVWRAHVQTDFLRGTGASRGDLDFLHTLLSNAVMSACARDSKDPNLLTLASSMYFHAGTCEWVAEFLSYVALIQAFEGTVLAEELASAFDLEAAASPHPTSGYRRTRDEMLGLTKHVVIPEGRGPSAFSGSEMLVLLSSQQQAPCLGSSGDETGVAAEFPYPQHTVLCRAVSEEPHPILGSGLRTSLAIPGDPCKTLPTTALELNELELRSHTRAHFLGSWFSGPQGTLIYGGFIPNVLHTPTTLNTIFLSQRARAKWLTCDILGYNWAEHYASDLRAFVDRASNG